MGKGDPHLASLGKEFGAEDLWAIQFLGSINRQEHARSMKRTAKHHLSLFLLGLSCLILEVTLSRLLSVITWYHLAFFAISTAMLGMTAGATRVYLRAPSPSVEGEDWFLSNCCVKCALSIPAGLAVLCLLPLNIQLSVMSVLATLLATVLCAVPFYFAGIVVTSLLTRPGQQVGSLYAADLVGASLGCIAVMLGLDYLSAPSLILACAAPAIAASILLLDAQASSARIRVLWVMLAVFSAIPLLNNAAPTGVHPVFMKNKMREPSAIEGQHWNSFSLVTVFKEETAPPFLWGPSPMAPEARHPRHWLLIDGMAGTALSKFSQLDDLKPLQFDLTNVGYYLHRPGAVCVIGVGGGRDLQSAIAFGHTDVLGVDINPTFIKLLKEKYRDYAGLSGRPGIRFAVDDARGYLSRTEERFSVIQMSLIDTWAATGAGAFSLTENSLYTVEAWKTFLSRLTHNGIFTVSRWHNPNDLGETGRSVSLAVAALLQSGVQNPTKHIALITRDNLSTLLISPAPFSPADIEALTNAASRLGFEAVLLPGRAPQNEILAKIVRAQSMPDLLEATSTGDLNFDPPTDEQPYFFNILRLRGLLHGIKERKGVAYGNLTATVSLAVLLGSLVLVTIAAIIVPLKIRARRSELAVISQSGFVSGACYFSLIGASFMLLEIGAIQRLNLFLGCPAYAVGVLLSAMIASTGLGSLLSGRLRVVRMPVLVIFPVATACMALFASFGLNSMVTNLINWPLSSRIFASIVAVLPMGFLMGLFFPTGVELAQRRNAAHLPWFLALNGVFGVLCSVLAVFLSIYFGLTMNFYLAAVGYVAAGGVLLRMSRKAA